MSNYSWTAKHSHSPECMQVVGLQNIVAAQNACKYFFFTLKCIGLRLLWTVKKRQLDCSAHDDNMEIFPFLIMHNKEASISVEAYQYFMMNITYRRIVQINLHSQQLCTDTQNSTKEGQIWRTSKYISMKIFPNNLSFILFITTRTPKTQKKKKKKKKKKKR